MMLFNIRTDQSPTLLMTVVNQALEREPDQAYVSRFGYVGSSHWWSCFDRGELPVRVLSGEVTHSGPRIEEWTAEEEDIVEFLCSGQIIGYERIGSWSAPMRVGDRVKVIQTIVEITAPTGTETYVLDVWAEWLPATAE